MSRSSYLVICSAGLGEEMIHKIPGPSPHEGQEEAPTIMLGQDEAQCRDVEEVLPPAQIGMQSPRAHDPVHEEMSQCLTGIAEGLAVRVEEDRHQDEAEHAHETPAPPGHTFWERGGQDHFQSFKREAACTESFNVITIT